MVSVMWALSVLTVACGAAPEKDGLLSSLQAALPRVDALLMPVHVNLVFVGFDGSGGHEFKLTRDTLSRWFGHLDYVVQHRHLDELVAQYESGHHDYSPVSRSLGYRCVLVWGRAVIWRLRARV